MAVGAKGYLGTENDADQPSTSQLLAAAVGVPTTGRLQRTASLPIWGMIRCPVSRCAPLPYSL